MGESPADDGLFAAVDPTVNVFALANGLDLRREESSRRLEWYADGSERGVRIDPDEQGTFRIVALAWATDDPDALRSREIAAGLSEGRLAQALTTAVTTANTL